MIIGTYKIVSGRRVIIPKEAREHIEKEYQLSAKSGEVYITPLNGHITGAEDLGARKLYQNAGKMWAVLPKKAMQALNLGECNSVFLFSTVLDGTKTTILRRAENE
jgi:hypothetical protein